MRIRFSAPPEAGITGVEVVFPKAVDFPQEGLPEPLLVFEREFTIGVQFTLAGSLPAGPQAVPFVLHYQACDDKVCYVPQRIPLTFRLRLVELDRQRVPAEVRAGKGPA